MSFLNTFNIIFSCIAAYLLHLLHPRSTYVKYEQWVQRFICLKKHTDLCHCGHAKHGSDCWIEGCSCKERTEERTGRCEQWFCDVCDHWVGATWDDYEVKCWVTEETESTSELIEEVHDPRIADLLELIAQVEEGFADDDDEYDGDVEPPRPFTPFINYIRVGKVDDDDNDDNGNLTPDSVLVREEFDDDSFFNLPS